MTDIKNLTGLEKPLTKLVETVSEGIGVLGNDIFKFDAKKIKRVGEAEAEKEKEKIIKKAEAEAEALGILERAEKRFALEQYNKQINLENVIVKSKELLIDEDVNDVPVDKDWTARFMNIAQDVSREEMQDLLARILTGEIKEPTSYTLKTLEIVKNLGKKDLEDFIKFAQFCTPDAGLFLRRPGDNEEFQKYGLSFGTYLHLADIGLFNQSTTLSLKLHLEENQILSIQITNKVYILKSTKKQVINLPLLKFTEPGSKIASILPENSETESFKTYSEDMLDLLKSKGLENANNDKAI